MANNDFKLIIINANKDKEKLEDFFNELFSEKATIVKDSLVYKLEGTKAKNDLHLANISESLKEDFGYSISIFESNMISKDKNVDAYIKAIANLNLLDYNNTMSTVLKVKDTKAIEVIRDVALQSLFEDTSLINVVHAMFKNNLNVSKAANDAFMHRNTVINKLDIITEKTSLNIQHFTDAMAMYVLLNNK